MIHRHIISLVAISAVVGTATTQTQQSVSPYWALNQVNSNNIYPYATQPMRYVQIHDWDTFSRQSVTLIKGVAYRASLQNYTNRTGRTVEVEMKMALAAKGITAKTRSTTFANNWDPTTIKTVIKKKKFSYPTSGPNLEALKEFTVKFPFDASASFLYITAQKRALVIETKQYTTTGGGYAFDFWSKQADKNGGFSHRDGSYMGCQATGGTVQHAVASANLYVGSPSCAFSGAGYGAKLPGLLLFGASGITGTFPGTKCELKTLPIFVLPFATGATIQGLWSVNLPIPNDPNLLLNSFHTQALYLDSSANKAGITTSKGLVNGFGTGNTTGGDIARVYFRGNPDTGTVASSNFLNGLVTMFHN